MLLLALTLLLACGDKDADSGTAASGDDTATQTDTDTDGGDTDGDTDTDGGTDTDGDGGDDTGADDVPGQSYVGPDYDACMSDAQCEPGSACMEVPGHASAYCAPPCDPMGDGSECDLTGTGDMGYETVCLETGRCARACEEDQAATVDEDEGTLIPDPDDACPEDLTCVGTDAAVLAGDSSSDTGAATDELAFLCAGAESGAAGPYGLCTHPQMDGPDCPEQHSCYGGSYIGLDVGVCLPWCDTGECPSTPDGTSASPLCYDIGLDHPVCALICIPGASTCPDSQECVTIYSTLGLCLPEGAEIPDF